MSVIIRLQNLPWSANALDIRQYFRGLSIPEGGVHIVGGELGDAFIAFSTDEDARQAFNMNGGKIKEVQIKLLLSSRTEMQKVIEAARNSTPFMQVAAHPPQPLTIPSAPLSQQVVPPIKSLESPDQIKSGVDSKSKSESKSSDKKRGRSRSRSKERRDRRDRSRDRKDRRRRDRSRSRDRRDRRRDRRDRSRSRDRSRTHDRSRSRDRDSTRKSRDKKRETSYDDKQNGDGSPGNNVTDLIDLTNESKPPTPWGDSVKPPIINQNFSQPALLGNQPITNTALEQARRSLGSLNAIRNQEQDVSPFNGGLRPRDSWPPGQQLNLDNRFPDKIQNLNANDNASNPVGVPPLMAIRPNLDRAFMTQNNAVPAFNRNNFENVRNQMNTGISRSLLGRPSLLGRTGPISAFDQRDNTPELHGSSDSEGMYREPRPKVPRPGCCVKVYIGRGGYGDVRRFFQGLFIANDGVKLINDKEGRRTGVAYVRFVRPDGKSEALKRSGQYNRGQPVDVAHLDDDEFDEAVDSFRPYDDNSDSEKSSSGREKPPFTEKIKNNIQDIDPKMCCLSILNLPPFTKEHDIIQMVGEHPLVSILMVMNRDNRQMAFIQFHKAEDAHKVGNMTEKHVISGKKVNVRLISETVFAEVKRQHNSGGLIDVPEEDQTQQQKTGGGGGGNAQQGNGFQRELLSDCIILKGLPYKTSDRDIIDFFSDVGLLPTRIHVPQGKFNKLSDCFCEFASSDEAQRALIKNGFPLGMGMSAVTVEMIPRPEMEKILGVGQPVQMEPRHGGNFHSNRHHSSGGAPMQSLLGPGPRMMQTNPQGTSDVIPEAFNNPGCVLALENVPFRANVDEILAFFQGFDIREENVLRRYNEKGHATGDARVAFVSPAEAQRALSELRHCKIRDRTIFMRLLQ